MMNPEKLMEKAESSGFWLRIMNLALDRMIPFNKPHGFKIREIGSNHVVSFIPYRKRNLNHIRGLHACALATLTEFTTGILMIRHLPASRYRLIMKTLEMDYHYQGKTDAVARFELSDDWIQEKIVEPLKGHDAVVVTCEVHIHDKTGNQLTTGKVHWQVKEWSKVRTKVKSA
ncbi:DUF4442 domain-containing protein [Roseivirga sp. BDSF3-8]|uniref:DUF4442 domain-containing protein n=1 Tax=Roseivirga sp. BDSF3-8 TaxID=3241598 RepID=UPI003531F45B